MTIKELIEALSEYPEDMEVLYDCGTYYGDMNKMYIEKHLSITGDIRNNCYFLVIKEK